MIRIIMVILFIKKVHTYNDTDNYGDTVHKKRCTLTMIRIIMVILFIKKVHTYNDTDNYGDTVHKKGAHLQ